MDQQPGTGGRAAGRGDPPTKRSTGTKRKRTKRAPPSVKRRIAENKATFLELLESEHDVRKACKRLDISSTTAYQWRERDKKFAEGWRMALRSYVDTLEASAFRRAVEGFNRPIMHKDKVVGVVRVYETALAIFLLKKLKPDVYSDRAHQVEGMSPEEYARRAREAVEAMEQSTVERVAVSDSPTASAVEKQDTPAAGAIEKQDLSSQIGGMQATAPLPA